MEREEILRQAALIVTGPRQETYGDAGDNFAKIADLWAAYLVRQISPVDVACMMALLKIARLAGANGDHLDSWVDACGYMAIGGELSGAGEVGDD